MSTGIMQFLLHILLGRGKKKKDSKQGIVLGLIFFPPLFVLPIWRGNMINIKQ